MTTKSLAIPTLFQEALEAAGMPAVEAWWSHLDEPSRSAALNLWADCSRSDSPLAIRIEAQPAEDITEEENGFWPGDFYEYLVNHEIYLFEVPGVHICTRHPVANVAARQGFIPHDFSCPFASADCPMHKLLDAAGNKAVKLKICLFPAQKVALR